MRCRPHLIYVLIALVGFLVLPGALPARTLTVDDDSKNGYETIQAAVDVAADGDVIVINPGTYAGQGNRDVNLRGKSITLQSTDPCDAGVVEATVIDCGGTTDNPRRGFWVYDCTSEIAGLTITHGRAAAGGAIYCEDAILTLINCRIVDNATLASGPGGGIYCYNAAASLTGCSIQGNSTGAGSDRRFGTAGSGGDGGGIYSANSVVYVSDSSIKNNTTGAGGDSDIQAGNGGDGAGICADALVVIDSTISGNVCGSGGQGPTGGTGGSGGGICSARASIERSVIEANAAGSAGDSSSGSKGNSGQDGLGGGLYCSDSGEIFSSLIAGNRSTDGSGIWCSQGLINLCTVVGNTGAQGTVDSGKEGDAIGAGVSCSAKTVVSNSILWDNDPAPIQGHDCDSIVYSNIQDGFCQGGLGNISQDPGFIQAGQWADGLWNAGDYHLASDSPCIDAGDPDYAADAEETDLDGRARASGEAVDMGAYEQTDLVPVYRFWSPVTNKHFYTIKEAEKDKLINQYADAWTYEGPVYYVYKRAVTSDVVPVYRLWSNKVASHFYTVDEGERDSLLASGSGKVWADEGVVFYAYSQQAPGPGSKPVYRFWSDSLASHFYTIKETEKDKLIAQYSNAWTYEGIVWYAFENLGADTGETPSINGSDVYEFTNTTDAATFQIELTAKVDGKPAQIDSPSLVFSRTVGAMEMVVDLKAMATELDTVHVQSGILAQAVVAGDRVSGQGQYAFNLSIAGAFDSDAVKGPYGIESRSLSFPTASGTGAIGAGEFFTIAGSATVDGVKSDINLALNATDFQTNGIGTFLESTSTDLLGLSMDGPFEWSRQGHEDLLFERTFKGRVLQIYVSGITLRTTGLWSGKQNPSDGKEQK